MTRPIEFYTRMKTDLEDAGARLKDLQDLVLDIFNDPFVAAPSSAVIDANEHATKAIDEIMSALKSIKPLAPHTAPDDERKYVGIIVDESLAGGTADVSADA